ncbi:uncharacterized protein LOC107023700 [Solanum pennellii]|uniref:Uncharacterized protein LOC107023700 n=1 Tax=Solanum pennellii TaxID=28526 RepID=A0ABM1H3U2_SOLPN|nr:uncharacterized protein LOC107023700 [Solanum pennellii]
MDLRKGYCQVRIAERDEPKIVFVNRYGAYKWLVMPFGLTNAPVTFSTLIKKMFHPYFDQFVVYLDDIFIYNNTFKEWQDFLAEFDYILEYKPGRGNVVADALRRKAELATITTTDCDIQDAIQDDMQHDLETKNLMELAAKARLGAFGWKKASCFLPFGGYMYLSLDR